MGIGDRLRRLDDRTFPTARLGLREGVDVPWRGRAEAWLFLPPAVVVALAALVAHYATTDLRHAGRLGALVALTGGVLAGTLAVAVARRRPCWARTRGGRALITAAGILVLLPATLLVLWTATG